MALTAICFVSCVDDEDFIQEGNLRVEYSQECEINKDDVVTVSVYDVRGTENLVVCSKQSYGKAPVEFTGINVGTYRVSISSKYCHRTMDVQIRKGQTAIVKF